MSSAPHLCGPQISCFRPGLTSLQPSILLLTPTLGLALQDAFGRSVLNIETGTPRGQLRGCQGGSWGGQRDPVFLFPTASLGKRWATTTSRCLFPCRLSLSGSLLQHIILNIHADQPYKAACLETIIFMCCCVKSQDHKITRLQHNHFLASGRLRPSLLLRALSVLAGASLEK